MSKSLIAEVFYEDIKKDHIWRTVVKANVISKYDIPSEFVIDGMTITRYTWKKEETYSCYLPDLDPGIYEFTYFGYECIFDDDIMNEYDYLIVNPYKDKDAYCYIKIIPSYMNIVKINKQKLLELKKYIDEHVRPPLEYNRWAYGRNIVSEDIGYIRIDKYGYFWPKGYIFDNKIDIFTETIKQQNLKLYTKYQF